MNQTLDLITVIKELYTLTGFRIAIYDTSLIEICSYPKVLSKFCQYIQETKVCLNQCIANDKHAFKQVQLTQKPYIYRCHMGLYEAVSPLYQHGVLSGYLMMGQTKDSLDSSIDTIQGKLQLYEHRAPLDAQQLKDLIDSIPNVSKDKISSYVNILRICASYITMNNTWKIPSHALAHKVAKYIQINYGKSITLVDLCTLYQCSKSTLSLSFKEEYHMSVIEYLTNIRLQHAYQYLEHSTLSIKEISYLTGYQDPNYFTKSFQKKYTMTPSAYRASLSSSNQ